jgi:hypothetical protein
MKSLILVAAFVAVAHAEPQGEVETQPLALVAKGMSVGYDRPISRWWSLTGSIGLRGAALGDYTSTTYDGAIEARYWKRAAMTGPYVGLHASAGRTSLEMSATGMGVGTAWGFEQRVDVGWRWTWGRLAITPSLGLGMHEDVGGLAPAAHPVLGVGLALGLLL